MPAKRHWTAAEDGAIRAARAARRSWDSIAGALGISRSAVIERARLLGLSRLAPLPPAPGDETGRDPLPAGHPRAWSLLTAGTLLDGAPYPFPPLR
jgi:hypothetical protein